LQELHGRDVQRHTRQRIVHDLRSEHERLKRKLGVSVQLWLHRPARRPVRRV
jgi:hypothetical protein